jgi:hypothetical protein
MLRLIRKVEVLTRIFPTLDLIIEEKAVWRWWKNPRSDSEDRTPEVTKKGQFPDESVRIKFG